ncbi:SMI1/KNR4 family protein [Pedobacter caeni]|uniref:SMI1/KNR4 family protein n=1 Tax=Pedobacter caeni TaxID=288992 RepID=UPI00093465F1|nr:SMI1/KNR4 family protein [Pedobacter caeni]
MQKIKRLYSLSENQNYGFSDKEIAELEARLHVQLPEKLKNYYLTLGKEENLNYVYNRLLEPDEEFGFSDDRYLVFYEENQVVAYWGIKEEDLKLPDPPVWGNYGTDEDPDWVMEAPTTEDFFLLMAVYNGTLGALKHNANALTEIDGTVVDYVRQNWQEVKEISSERQRVYTDDFYEVISLSFDEQKNCTAAFVGTSNRERFDKILDNLDIDWSYTSDEDEDFEEDEDEE